MRFENQVALITGAGSGLGRAYAIMLAERGAKLVLIDQPKASSTGVQTAEADFSNSALHQTTNHTTNHTTNSALHQTHETILKLGVECLCFEVDVSQQAAVNIMLNSLLQRWQSIDILINNAGIYGACVFEHIQAVDWQRQFEVDVNGSFYLTQALWPLMKAQGYGRILMTTGVSALFGDVHQVAFSAAKMALVGMVNSLSIEGEHYNIHVNSLCPQALTDMTRTHLAPAIQPLFSVETLTATVAFLVSSKAPNGQHLLAGAGSVSHGRFAEFQSIYFSGGQCTPDKLVRYWPELYHAFPVNLHSCGEDKVLAWSKQSALEHQIKIE